MYDTQVVHKEKGYQKAINTIFTGITKDKLEFEQDTQLAISFEVLRIITRYLSFSVFLTMPSIDVMYLLIFLSMSAISSDLLTSSTLSSASEQDTQLAISFEEHEYIFKMKRISIKDVLDNSEVIESAGNEKVSL